MSTTIDQRVVEMRFDNKQFESNVRTSMSTLDRLKQSLNLTGAAKGLENISVAAKKIDLSGLAKGAEAVEVRFSYLQATIQHQINRIVGSCVNAGKRMVSALTIDPVKTGFSEYETQINAIQTILANTQKEGTTVETVNKALDELNLYADKTIYNFTEMTRNIGTFTAAGVKLQTSVDAIQGIANLAAVSGSTSQQASTAMYQLSQALASGTVKLMDWNSVVNAGMGGQLFQDALKETSALLGTGAAAAIEAEGSFRDSLKTGWLTAEVLTETLKKFTTSGANEYVAKYTGLSEEAVAAALEEAKARYGEANAIEYASKALAEKSGKNAKEIQDVLQFAATAEDAATKVKTFSQLWDTMKEAAQSGWSQTWRLIIGDFEEAKNLLTPISDFFTGENGIITKMSNARNEILESALGKNFSGLAKALNMFFTPATKAATAVDKVTDSVGNLDEIVTQVIRGDWGNYTDRYNKLTEAGYNWMEVQNKVNETLGDSKRYTAEQIAEQDKILGANKKTADSTNEVGEAVELLTEKNRYQLKYMAKYSEEQLRAQGYTEAQIAVLKDLKRAADDLGIPIETFIDQMDEINGRWLLLNSFKNIGTAIVKVFKAIGSAWSETFDPITGDTLFRAIGAFHKFTSSLILSKTNADKLKRTFKGLFAIIDMITTITGGGLKIAFKILSAILGAFDMNILDLTANIGDAIVAFRDFIFENNGIAQAVNTLITNIPAAIKTFREWFAEFKELPIVQKAIDVFISLGGALKNIGINLANGLVNGIRNIPAAIATIQEWFNAFKELPLVQKAVEVFKDIGGKFREIGSNIIDGLKNGIGDKLGTVVSFFIELGHKIVDTIKSFLGIHSPSTVFREIGVNIIQGLVEGISTMIQFLLDLVKNVAVNVKDAYTSLFASADNIGEGEGLFDKIKEIFKKGISAVGDFIKSSLAWLADYLGDIDIGQIFAILFGTGVVYFIKQAGDLISGIASFFDGLGDVFGGVEKVLKSASKIMDGFALNLKAKAIKEMAIALAILVGAIIVLTFLDPDKMYDAVGVIVILAGVLLALAAATNQMAKASSSITGDGIKTAGLMVGLIGIGAALLLLAFTVKLLGNLDPEQAARGFEGLAKLILALVVVFAAYGSLVKGKAAQNIDKAGGMLLKLSISLLLLVLVCKLVGNLSAEEMIKGGLFMTAFVIFVAALVLATKSAGKNIDKVGGMLIKLSIAMMLMVGVCKLASMLSLEEMGKGALFAAGFVAFVGALVAVTKVGKGQETAKVAGLILAVSFSLLLMVGVCKLVGMLSVGEIVKGVIFAAAFTLLIAALVKITKTSGDKDMKGVAATILAMSVAIAIMAAVAIVLSLMSVKALAKGLIAVGILGLIMAVMISATKGAADCKSNLIVMAAAIAVMAIAVAGLATIDTEKLAGATAALVTLMLSFALMAVASKSANGSIKSLVALVGVVVVLAAVVYILSSVPTGSTLESVASISLLLVALSASMLIISKSGSNAMKAMPAMYAMIGIVGILTALVYILANLPLGSTLEIAASISLLLLSMSASMAILSALGSNAMAAMPAAYAMSGVVAILAVIIGVLAALKLESTLEIAASLSMLLLSLSISCVILAGAAAIASVASAGIGSLIGLMATMGILMAAIAGLVMYIPDLESFLGEALPILNLLGQGIGEFVGGIVAGVLTSISATLPQLGTDLSAFMENAQGFIDGARNIDESVLAGVGYISAAILALTVADLIAGISSMIQFGSDFADLGADLSAFMVNATAFILGMSTVPSSLADNTASIASAILALSAANILDGISRILGFGDDGFASLGKKLVPFGQAMVEFSSTVAGKIDQGAVEAAATAGEVMAGLQKTLPRTGGWLQEVLGEQDLEKFGKSCSAFGREMVKFSKTIVNNGGINEDAVNQAANAGEVMAGLQKALPRTGGWVQEVLGEQDLASFGLSCAAFGTAMVTFSRIIVDNGGINEDAVNQAARAGEVMAALEGKLPKQGGWAQAIMGKQELDTFGESLVSYATAITTFSKTIVEGGISDQAVEAAANAGLIMADLQEAIPEQKWFDGKVDLPTFGGQIAQFGEKMALYSTNVSGLDVTRVEASTNAAHSLVSLVNELIDLDTSGIDKFATVDSIGQSMNNYSIRVADISTDVISKSITDANRLVTLMNNLVNVSTEGLKKFTPVSIATQMKNYSAEVKGINTTIIETSIKQADKLRAFIHGLAVLNTNGVDNFKKAVNTLGKLSLTETLKSFNGAPDKLKALGKKLTNAVLDGMKSTKKESFSKVGKDIVSSIQKPIKDKVNSFTTIGKNISSKFLKGIKNKKSDIPKVFTSSLTTALSKIEGYKDDFYNAGSSLVTGFTNGISENMYKAEAKARAMAEAAVKAAKDALKINSPSKVMMAIAESIPEGFAKGIDDNTGMVKNSSIEMARTALSSTSKTLSRLGDMINNGIDSQPTIRPVLDLSDVRSGAGTINGMLSNISPISATASVDAINSMMNQRIQNGTNNDVVSAINKLRKELGNVGSTTYNVNGVTYDDGSNVSDAVKSLVRAARVERRK